MTSSDVNIAVRNTVGGMDINVVVSGPLDPSDVPTLTRRLLKIVEIRQPRTLELDASEVESAGGLAELRRAIKHALHELGGRVTFVGPPDGPPPSRSLSGGTGDPS